MVEIAKVARRVYRCVDCGNETIVQTNHIGTCWPRCTGACRRIANEHTSRELVMPAHTPHVYVKDADT